MVRNRTQIVYSDICGLIESSRGICGCGWETGWDNGYQFVTRLRVWWHRNHCPANTSSNDKVEVPRSLEPGET